MKVLSHPNIVNLVEVIDDPTTDHFYMGINAIPFVYPVHIQHLLFKLTPSILYFSS